MKCNATRTACQAEGSPALNTVKTTMNEADIELLVRMHRSMLRIRMAEERIGELVAERKVICPAHLSIGQEAVAVGVCSALKRDDYLFSTHRAHGHYLAKGGDLNGMMAEVFGKENGCSGGRGGSMHLVQPENGIMGTSSIVGGCFPIAVGGGLASSLRKDGKVSVVFFGDGAMDEGAFFESINFAAIRKLPVIFVCENNFYATHMRICRRITCDRDEDDRGAEMCDCDQLIRRAHLFHVEARRVDGNDVQAVYEAASEAVDHARNGKGPYFLDCMTYRWRGHVGPSWDVDMGLRSQTEIDAWKDKCPIKRIEECLRADASIDNTYVKSIYEDVRREVDEAIKFANDSAYPSPGSAKDKVYR